MQQLGVDQKVLLEAGLAAVRDDGTVDPAVPGPAALPDPRSPRPGRRDSAAGSSAPASPSISTRPRTPIFHKGRQLYNLHQAKGAIRKEETVILVEGYFDVLRLVLAGVEHVVAPLGTALTPDQGSLAPPLRAVRDAALRQRPGRASARRSAPGDELLRHGVRVRVATLPAGEDPDTLVRRGGAAALEPMLADAIDLLERKIQLLERRAGSRASSTGATRSTGCCPRFGRRLTRSPASCIFRQPRSARG